MVDEWRFGVAVSTVMVDDGRAACGLDLSGICYCSATRALQLILVFQSRQFLQALIRAMAEQQNGTPSFHRTEDRPDRPLRRDRGCSPLADLKSGTPLFLTRGSNRLTSSITTAHSRWRLSADSQRPERRSCSPFDAKDSASCSLSRTYAASCWPDIAEISGAVSDSSAVATEFIAVASTCLLSGLSSDCRAVETRVPS